MADIAEIRVGSWIELIDELYRDAWDEAIRRHRSPYVFRGCALVSACLQTTLQRMGYESDQLTCIETQIARNFRKYAHRHQEDKSLYNWLALAQHHGLQTRLLDWTYSPLVALHFMTEDMSKEHEDGVVWCINHRRTLEYVPEKLREIAKQSGANAFTPEMIDDVAPHFEDLPKLGEQPYVLFLEPPTLDPRIESQFALFSMMSDPRCDLQKWLQARPDLAKRIVVPSSLKWEVRDKLDQSGITERLLYPGLDGLARWMSRYYRPR
ncbi:MAG TPA: FRG domain-containing protein [Bryobacteraceae bacterium]|nr:FRG domain-containing protein [Bryobacteraceae bacterium]